LPKGKGVNPIPQGDIKINTTIKPTGICKKLFSLAKVTIPNQIDIATAKMG
jgi:hypothetical protein